MPRGWVFDSAGLIILGRIEALDIVNQLPGKDEKSQEVKSDPSLS